MRTCGRGAWLFLLVSLVIPPSAGALEQPEMLSLLKTVDERQSNTGDYKSLMYMEQKERGKSDVVYEMAVYRRDADDKLMFLFTKPKTEAGKGYLRAEKNFWMYDPSVGKWDRKTERERIGGTNSTRSDFDESRLAIEYDPTYEGEEKLGAFTAHKISLKVKEGVDVAYPIEKIWVDKESSNVLKKEDYALSGKLMRTSYYPKWKKIFSESKHADVWFPQEMRIYDEIEKGTSTLVLTQEVDLRALETNMFTKAWLEGKSR
jgi:outer membrane lipoprotein-sorting protein